MTNRASAEDFNGDIVFPLPIHGFVKHAKRDPGIVGIGGSWEVQTTTEGGTRPTAVIDEKNEQFVIATSPGGTHDYLSEVDIAHATNFGTFVVMDMFQGYAKDWLSDLDPQMLQKQDIDPLYFEHDSIDFGSFDEGVTAAMVSRDPDRSYGTAFVFWRPQTQYLDRIVDRIPFKTGSPTLEKAAEIVIRELNLPRGKKKQLSFTKRGDPEKGKELQDKFGSFLSEIEDNQ